MAVLWVARAMAKLKDNPDHWRKRAAEARAQASQMRDEDSRQQMLEIAKGYERLAESAEKHMRRTVRSDLPASDIGT